MKKIAIVALIGVVAMAGNPHRRHLDAEHRRPQPHGHRALDARREQGGKRPQRHLNHHPAAPKHGDGRKMALRGGDRHPRVLGTEPTKAEIEAKIKEGLTGFCGVLQNATLCAKSDCVSTELGLKDWDDYDNFWAAYAWEVHEFELDILRTLAVVGFEWEKVVEFLSNKKQRSLSVDLEKDDTLTMWAGALAGFCEENVKNFDLDGLKKYLPMSNDADYFGAVAVNFEIGLGSLIIELIEKEDWNFDKAGAALEEILEAHCPIVAFGYISTEIEFTDGDQYWQKVEVGLAEGFAEIVEYLAKKANETLPTDAEFKAGAKKIGEAVGKKCAATFKIEEADMKKAAEEEYKWKCEQEKKMLL